MGAKYATRYEAVFLCTQPKGPKMSQSAAAKYVKKSKALVQKWIRRYKLAKNVDDVPELGSIGKMDEKDEKIIVNLFSRNPASTLRNLVHLPKTTPEGYQILLYSIKDNDCKKFVFADAVKGFAMYTDCIMSEHGLCPGYIIILDMKGVTYGHLARVEYAPIKAFILYAQEGHPGRLKGVHVLNTVPWIHHVLKIVTPMVKPEYVDMVKFHKGNIPEGIPIDLLPVDYGGESSSIAELDEQSKNLVLKYALWLKETQFFQVDEEKRPKKQSWWDFLTWNAKPIPTDKESFIKNLQEE